MIQKKICMLGATGVGKTSLVRRFVQSIFSEKYHTTLGVKIDKKLVSVEGEDLTLMLWDIQGEDSEFKIRPSFLRGASGYLLVVDLTRRETLGTAVSIQKMVEQEVGELPSLVLFNKSDLSDEFEVGDEEIAGVCGDTLEAIKTSAKTGDNVENAFQTLAKRLIEA